MALGRLNRPGLMVYGGTIRPGSCAGQPQLDIVSAFQSYGQYLQEGKTEEAEKKRYDTVRNACPGPGACGGECLTGRLSAIPLLTGEMLSSLHRHVHGKHDGVGSRSSRHDPARLVVLPSREPGEDAGMRRDRSSDANSP